MFGVLLSHQSIEKISRITSDNEQQNYRNTQDFIANETRRDQMINDYILTQYIIRAGLKKFGEGGRKATMKELHQMLTREVFGNTIQGKLTYEQKLEALPILLFLTPKRDGTTIKGRAYTDERPQRIWTDKQESAPHIITVEALFYTLAMYAIGGRDVTTCKLLGYFLQTGMEEDILL